MLGGGKSGIVNEATNHLANQNLTKAVEFMGTKEYQKTRDATDVIPTHRREVAKKDENRHLQVYDPTAEKEEEHAERHEGEGDDDDEELMFIRERRVAAMKRLLVKEQEWRAKQHGSYREIAQDDFFSCVVRDKGGSDDVAVHFYHKNFERCKIMDRHIGDLAPSFMSVKFVKIDVEKAPFLVEKLKVTVLPCVVLFHNDVACDRIVGFDELGGDDFTLATLRDRVEKGLKMHQE